MDQPVRAATYLVTRGRLREDRKTSGKIKCNPPNRQCGDRCIPPNWKCRVKGEGTDSHSRVVAADPLAGVASIQRGRKRLKKGLKTGNIEEIQAGRAAIARGVVKVTPGKNIQSKQRLRARVERTILPVATTLFGIWAVNQGHEAAKKIVPGYKDGIGKSIEDSAGRAVGFIFDRVPFYGAARQAARRRANVAGQKLARAVVRGQIQGPDVSPKSNAQLYAFLGTQSDRKITGVRTAIEQQVPALKNEGYESFRSRFLSGVMGAQDVKTGQSIFANAATIEHLSKQFGLNSSRMIGADDNVKKTYVKQQIVQKLTESQSDLRKDMRVRGLSYTKQEDVEKYVEIASGYATRRMNGLNKNDTNAALNTYKGFIRDLVSPTSKETSVSALTSKMYDETFESFDSYFKQASARVAEDTSPTARVLIPAGDSPLRAALLGTARFTGPRVGVKIPINSANVAELVIRKTYYELSQQKTGYRANRKISWSAPDSDIRAAARDLGWDGNGGIVNAFRVVKATGAFENLQEPPVSAVRPARSIGPSQPPRPKQKRAPRLRSEGEIISMLRKGDPSMSYEAALNEARNIIAKRTTTDAIDDISKLNRLEAYLITRVRFDKPCGASYIPENKKCSKTTTTTTKSAKNNIKELQPSSSSGFNVDPKLLIGGASLVGLSVAGLKAVDDIVKTRSRQFGEPTFQTFNDKIGDPDKFNNASDKKKLSAGAFGDTSMVTIDGKTFVVKNPKMPSKETRKAMATGLTDQATRNLFRAQGRMTKSEVANTRLAAELGLAPKVVAADRRTLVSEVARGRTVKKLDEAQERELHGTLAKLHRAGIAHNDLKPDNFFIDNNNKIQLIDFGLSMRSPSGVAREWYRAMNPSSPNPLIKLTGTATGSFNLKKYNPEGYNRAEKALSTVLGESVSEGAIIRASKDPQKNRQMQIVINNYYEGKYNRASLRQRVDEIPDSVQAYILAKAFTNATLYGAA